GGTSLGTGSASRVRVSVLWQAGQSSLQLGVRRFPAVKSCSRPQRGQVPCTPDTTSVPLSCRRPATAPKIRKVGTSTKCSPGTNTKPTAKAQRTPADRPARTKRWPGEAVVTVTTAGEGEAPKLDVLARFSPPFAVALVPTLPASRGRRRGDAWLRSISWDVA